MNKLNSKLGRRSATFVTLLSFTSTLANASISTYHISAPTQASPSAYSTIGATHSVYVDAEYLRLVANTSQSGPVAFSQGGDPVRAAKDEMTKVMHVKTFGDLSDHLTNQSCAKVGQALSIMIGASLGMMAGAPKPNKPDTQVNDFRSDFRRIILSNIEGHPAPNEPLVLSHPRKFLTDLQGLIDKMHRAKYIDQNQMTIQQDTSWPPISSFKFTVLDDKKVKMAPHDTKLVPMYALVEDGKWRLDMPVQPKVDEQPAEIATTEKPKAHTK